MNIYDAIMKAADHIERHPKDFDFDSVKIPGRDGGCGTPGCALGWIAFFSPAEISELPWSSPRMRYYGISALAENGLGLSDGSRDFYNRMNELKRGWSTNAPDCAKALRLYAAKYHAPAPVLVPDWNAMAAKQTVSAEARSQELVS